MTCYHKVDKTQSTKCDTISWRFPSLRSWTQDLTQCGDHVEKAEAADGLGQAVRTPNGLSKRDRLPSHAITNCCRLSCRPKPALRWSLQQKMSQVRMTDKLQSRPQQAALTGEQDLTKSHVGSKRQPARKIYLVDCYRQTFKTIKLWQNLMLAARGSHGHEKPLLTFTRKAKWGMTASLGFYSQVERCLERDELFYQLSNRQNRIQHVGKPQSPDFQLSSIVFKKFLILHYS